MGLWVANVCLVGISICRHIKAIWIMTTWGINHCLSGSAPFKNMIFFKVLPHLKMNWLTGMKPSAKGYQYSKFSCTVESFQKSWATFDNSKFEVLAPDRRPNRSNLPSGTSNSRFNLRGAWQKIPYLLVPRLLQKYIDLSPSHFIFWKFKSGQKRDLLIRLQSCSWS